MIDFESALTAVRLDVLKLAQLEHDRLDLLNSNLNAAMKDERDRDYKCDIERQRLRLIKVLREIVEFPPHHLRHEACLAKFHSIAAFDKSVFVMTKFPDPRHSDLPPKKWTGLSGF